VQRSCRCKIIVLTNTLATEIMDETLDDRAYNNHYIHDIHVCIISTHLIKHTPSRFSSDLARHTRSA